MANAYILVVFGILCAKAAGFLRDVYFASEFSTGMEADIYLQIYGIASLLFTAVGSALSTLVIKNINKKQYSEGDNQNKYAASFLRFIAVLILGITIWLYIFSGKLVSFLLPGLGEAEHALALNIMHIMLPSFLFICIAYVMSGLLQNRRVFFTPSIMSLPYNVIVICVLALGIKDIRTISIITTLGWFLHIVILLPDFFRKGYSFTLSAKGLGKTDDFGAAAETFFIFVSGMMFQLCFLADKTLIVYEEGGIASLSYASNLFITFSGVFVVAMSSVVFPAISQNFEHGEMDYVRELIRYILKLMLSIFVFYLIAVVFFGKDLIRIIYERGEFTAQSTLMVATPFIIYSFGIFGYLAQNILNKLFYIAGKYKLTVIGAVVVVVIKVLIDKFLAPYFNANFAAITTTILLTLYAIFIAWQLKNIIGNYITKELMLTVGKIVLSAALSAASIMGVNILIPEGILNLQFGFLIPFAIGFLVYGASMFITGVLKDLFTTPLSRTK